MWRSNDFLRMQTFSGFSPIWKARLRVATRLDCPNRCLLSDDTCDHKTRHKSVSVPAGVEDEDLSPRGDVVFRGCQVDLNPR